VLKRVLKWKIKRCIRQTFSQNISDNLLGQEAAVYHLWSIGMYAGKAPNRLFPQCGISNPVLTRDHVTDVRALFVADPFMIRKGDTWFMFFEVYNYDTDRGEIGFATSRDAVIWRYEQIVLREPFHLSYPYVFEWADRYYMIPESHQAQSIRLYQSQRFPLEWTCTDVLISGQRFSDNSAFHFQGYWWMFSDTNPELKHDTLRLYFSRQLGGPWQEHPASPIISGNPHIARPAGRVIVNGNRVIRFAQDCFPLYGIRVHAYEITELSPSSYQEHPISPRPVLGPNWQEWSHGGMHHLDPHPLSSDQWIAPVDGWRPVDWLVPDGWTRSKC